MRKVWRGSSSDPVTILAGILLIGLVFSPLAALIMIPEIGWANFVREYLTVMGFVALGLVAVIAYRFLNRRTG